ncbi:NACHT domain-containing protein [Kitasatospora sp. NPDC088783]|uniref:NACHT domain-containing protein n=1 Tax=Kitasatospora sp. NPDC088783 TaxID=3364077 RepID=UPI0038134B62
MPSDDKTTNADEAVKRLAAGLSALRQRAGQPSLREIARLSNGTLSHTTAAEALSGKRVPSWQVVAELIRSLDGDEKEFRPLWVAATEKSPAPTASEREDLLFLTRYRRMAINYFSASAPGARSDYRRFFDFYEPPRIVRVSEPQDNNCSVEEFDHAIHHALLLGDTASGKTMLCHALALRHAVDDRSPTAFFVPLLRFSGFSTPSTSVVGFIEHSLESVFQLRPPAGLVERHLDRKPTLVMFDGLSEIHSQSRVNDMITAIKLFSVAYPKARILVTSSDPSHRHAGRLDPSIFITYALMGTSAAREKKNTQIPEHEAIPAEVLSALKVIRDLMHRSRTEPAFGLHAVTWSWGTLENCLQGMIRDQDARDGEDTHSEPSHSLYGVRLIAEAEARGLIARKDSERLRSAWYLRNQIAHSQQPSATLAASAINDAVEGVVQVIYRLYETASQGSSQ